MNNSNQINLWEQPTESLVPINLTQPNEIAEFAQQLTVREKEQVVSAYKNGSYEMATSFVWGRAMASLKRELGTLGITFLAELLNRADITENDSVLDAITEKEAIKLAEELGMASRTEAMRLRHAQELVSHFSQREPRENDDPMEQTDAIGVLSSCVRSILSKPSVQVARQFAEFRKDLETVSFEVDDSRCQTLVGSPYFFRRLAIAVLLSGIRTNTGAKLEHCLSNFNLLLPLLWPTTRETEKWQVGSTYAQVYADGLQMQTTGMKKALVKVRGFDYVPENLRSQTFIKAAEAIIKAHEGINNFYNEPAPVMNLEKLGTVIPAPAFGFCMTALVCVSIGNAYGVSFGAKTTADGLLKKQSIDRWSYYLDKILPGDTRILEKLLEDKPMDKWIELICDVLKDGENLEKGLIKNLIEVSLKKDRKKLKLAAEKIIDVYYKKTK